MSPVVSQVMSPVVSQVMSRLAAHLSYAIPTMTQTNQSKALNVLLTLDKKQLSTHDIITKKCRPTVIRYKINYSIFPDLIAHDSTDL